MMRATLVGVVLFAVLLSACRITSKTPSLSEAERQELLGVPVVQLMFPGRDAERNRYSSAVALPGSRSELLLSPHQLPAEHGVCHVDGHKTEYEVVQRVSGETNASGWAIIRLTDALSPQTPIAFDFDVSLERCAELYLVSFPTTNVVVAEDASPLEQELAKALALQQRKKTIVAGQVIEVRALNSRVRVDEFLCTDIVTDDGASGGPVMWRSGPDGRWKCIGIWGGFIESGDVRLGLIRRPHELRL